MNKKVVFLLKVILFLLSASSYAAQEKIINNHLYVPSSDGRIYKFDMNRQLSSGWPVELQGVPVSNVVACELDDDINTTELAVFVKDAQQYKIYLINDDGNMKDNRGYDVPFTPSSDPVIIKTGKGRILFAGTSDGNIEALSLNGLATLEGWPKTIDKNKAIFISGSDINGDGMDDIVMASGSGKLCVLSYAKGDWGLSNISDAGEGIACAPLIADINNDGSREAIIATVSGKIIAYTIKAKGFGTALWTANIGEPATAVSLNNSAISCTSIYGNNFTLDGTGKLMKKTYMPANETGTVLISSDTSGEVRAESGPFHHFTQPEDTEISKPALYFSPNGDGVQDTADLKLALTFGKLTNYKYSIIDSGGTVISTLKDASEIPSGQEISSWGGVGGISFEAFQIVLTADSYMSDPITAARPVILDNIPPAIESVSSYSIFSPNGDGFNDTLPITFNLSKRADVYIKMIDQSGNIVKSDIIKNAVTLDNGYVWDGKNANGEVVNGEFRYHIQAKDFAGNSSAIYEGKVTVDSRPYLIIVEASPESISNVINNPKPVQFYMKVLVPCTIEAYLTASSATVRSLVPLADYAPGDYVITWEGTNDAGKKLAEGSYNYIFFARNPKLTTEKQGIVRVDNTKPYASQISLTPSEESIGQLNNDTTSNEVTLSYYLSENSYVTVDILDPTGLVISNVTSNLLQQAKSNTVTFTKDKLLSNGIFTPGENIVRISLVDEAGNEDTFSSAKFVIDSGFNISGVSALPATFTPNGDNHDDFVTFKYTATGGSGDVSTKIKIKNLAGATVKTLTNLGVGARVTVTDFWYGNDEQNNPCPDGQYTYDITATDSGGNSSAPITGNLTLVRSPMIITYADPKSISPNGDGIADDLTLFYNIDYQGKLAEGNSNVAATIYDKDGNKVFYFSDTKPEGNYSTKWGGENNFTGGIVPDGTYDLQIVSSDPTGTIYSYITNLAVSRGAPNVVDNGVTEPIITPNGDGQQDETTIKYQVENVGNLLGSVEVNIYNSSTTFDATTLVKSFSGSVNGDTVWDGSVDVKGGNGDADNNGYADKGLYKYVIVASDLLGNVQTYVSSNEIEVDKVYLSFVQQTSNPDNCYFSPNADNIKDAATISYLLTTTQESNTSYAQVMTKKMKAMASNYNVGKVTIKVKDMSGSTIKTITNLATCEKDMTYVATWDGTNDSDVYVADAPYTIEVTAVDMINDPATNNMEVSCEVDTAPPVASFTQPAEYTFLSGAFDIKGTITDLHPSTFIVYRQNAVLGSGSGGKSDEKLASFDTYGLNGDYPVYIVATDEAGNTSAAAARHFYVDNTPPVISQPTSEAGGVKQTFFNPYTDTQISIEVPVSDESFDTSVYPDQSQPHSISVSAEVYLNSTLIRSLSGSTYNSNGQLNLVWDGKNLNGDYVNEGDYTVSISGVDSTGNVSSTYEYTCSVADDQQLTSFESGSYSHDPNLTLNGTNLGLKFITGESYGQTEITCDANGDATVNKYFCIEFNQTLTGRWRYHINASSGYHAQADGDITNDSGVNLFSFHYGYNEGEHGGSVNALPATAISSGRFWIYTYANWDTADIGNNDQTAHSQIWVDPSYYKYNVYANCANISNFNSWLFVPTAEIKPVERSVTGGTKTHTVFNGKFYVPSSGIKYFDNNEIIYSPGEIRLSSAEGDSINPSIACDSTGQKVYVVWEDNRNGSSQLFYNKSVTSGGSWSGDSMLPILMKNCSDPSITYNNGILYLAYVDDLSGFHNLYVTKSLDEGVSWITPVRITRYEFSGCIPTKPSIVGDSSGNAYVAWEDTRTGTSEIWFQKIPSNFAPFSSSGMTTMSFPKSKPVIAVPLQTFTSSSSPELISPISEAAVKSLRPTFKWYGIQNVPDYRIECAATSDADALNGTMDYFTATIADVSAVRPICEYVVPEHSMGLDENDQTKPYWYWRVKSVTTEATTSEVGSFKIELPASISGVTNWPNPFDPNKETTKIRYKLGREPESVTIRIYDIAGRLVKEMDGATNPEGANIMNKYNDVEWDGRNGRGDMVMNGVYPFEITVNYGNKTELGRGKIVVLK